MAEQMKIRAEGTDSEVTINLQPENAIHTGVRLVRGYEADFETLEPIHIEMACGKTYELSSENLPDKDLPCACGNPNHWFFRWGAANPEKEFIAAEYP